MSKYTLSRLADQDVEGIAEYSIQNFGARRAKAYGQSIRQNAQLIADFPPIGRYYTTKQGKKFQHFAVGRHVIFYQPTDAGIFIVRVLHQMMDFDRHLDV